MEEQRASVIRKIEQLPVCMHFVFLNEKNRCKKRKSSNRKFHQSKVVVEQRSRPVLGVDVYAPRPGAELAVLRGHIVLREQQLEEALPKD